MRKLSLVILSVALVMNLHAQKAKVVTAYNYYNYKEFDKAKAAIDEASVNEQSSGMEKTWYYRGMIYLAIAGDAKFKAATPNALEEASKSYNKILELNPKSEYKKDAEQALVSIKALVFNEGLDAYNAKDYNLALSRFEWASQLSPGDTNILTNCAVSAQSAGNTPVAIKYYERLIESNTLDVRTYNSLINLYKKDGQMDKASALLKKGVEKFPNDEGLRVMKINEALEKGDVEKSIDELNAAIAKDPTNAALHSTIGVMYDKMATKAKETKSGKQAEFLGKAEESYKKAIELTPDNFDSNYNLGVLYFNQGAEFINTANDLPPSKAKEYDAMIAKADAKFKAAQPYFEKGYSLKADDFNLLQSLKQLYVRLNLTESEMYNKVIKALEKK